MTAFLVKYWESVRASYWFIPSLMALGAIVMSIVFVAMDARLGAEFLEDIEWLSGNKPEGARDVLSTIAGSMITVAGVTFSITIAAVAYATQQFGPRLLTNFMRDRGNQITLGTFIATFLYCLLVLRTIRGAEEPITGDLDPVGAFVPHIAILVAILFALASIGVLIYFIHHVPESIHAGTVSAEIGKDLSHRIDKVFPSMVGEGGKDTEYDADLDLPADFHSRAHPVLAAGSGYIQYVADNSLIRVAKEKDILIRLQYAPGDFVQKGRILALAYPGDRLGDSGESDIMDCFAWGRKRTQVQDIMFLADELIEISARALSPGINDPFTALNCMDWLGSSLSNLAQRQTPSPFRYDEQRTLRVIARPMSFSYFADAVFDRMRPYVTDDELTAVHAFELMAQVLIDATNEQARQTIIRHAEAYRAACFSNFDHERIRAQIEDRYRLVQRLVREPENAQRLADEHRWFQGSA